MNNNTFVNSVSSVEKIDRDEASISDVGAKFISLENKLFEIQREFKTKNEELRNFILL